MIKKIFFGSKPVFLCSAINSKIERILESKGTIYIDEITKSAVYNIAKQVSNPSFEAVVFFSSDLKKLQKSFFAEFDIVKAGGGLVRNELGEILFIFRKGFWDLPKGKKDPGEKYKQCAIREVEEETGLTQVEAGKRVATTYHTYIENGRKILKKTRWYNMTASKLQPLTPQTNEGIQKIEWVNSNDVPGKLANSFPLISDVLEKGDIAIDP
jgi:8-oxo-dGTP pyrophosphatase MutT (NUDIX family)